MAVELLRSRLPHPWTFGVTEDGRIFFINDESKSTTWLHPVYNHPIQSGHLSRHDLPKGWELAFTPEGIPYYVDHTNLRTSFIHPVTGESALPVHEDKQAAEYYAYENKDFRRSSLRRSSKKQKVIDKVPVPKRSEHAPVTLKGWLYKQDSGGLKSWKKRWFVLSDFCLYYYKDSSETQLQGSILLPSYQIGFCNKSDGVNRKYSFKAEHQNMRTYYFATDNSDDQACWMNALKLASQLKNHPLEDNSQPQPPNSYPQIEGQSPESPPSQDCGDLNDSGQDRMLRSSANDPNWYNSQVNSSNQSHMTNNMYNQDQNTYQHDPRMRSGQGQQVMRNTYITHEPAYPDPRPQYSSNQQRGDRRPDPGVVNYGTQYQDSYRHGDRESLSSHGSRGMVPRDHNYNVPKGSYPVHSSQSNVPGTQQQDSNTLERSTDSVERTLDRSFDSVEVLPGYDSFAENHLRPASQYQQQPGATDGSVPVSRNSSLAEGQRQNSLLRLQQWTKNQQDKVYRQQQQHPNDHDHPPSDGVRKYGQDSTHSISSGGYSHRSPPDLRLNLDTEVKQPEEGDQPARPPIPAEYREQYIRELAETKTPDTRSDLLTSIEIQRMKQQEPLVFQYPEDRLEYERKQGKENIQSRPGFSSEDVQSSQHALDPSKSWDDLNDLDPDEAQFKYNSRIDLLLAEKRRIMGETSDVLRNPNPDGSQTLFRDASAAEGQNYNDYDQLSESQNHSAHGTLNEQMNSEYSKPIRRNLETAFKGHKEANLYENMGTYGNATAPSGDKPWPNQMYPSKSEQDYREQIPPDAAHSHQHLGDSRAGQDGWGPAASQSEHDVHYQQRPPVGQNLPWNFHPTNPESLSHSLGNLHVDVGEWPDSGVAPDRAASRPPWQKTEPLLGKMMPTTSTGNVLEEGHNGMHNGTPPDGQEPAFEYARRDIETIKEDPNMSDQDILTTKTLADLQRHLSGHRLRLSISAGDLIGKSHEELVLLLIQLRRDQSRLERARDYYRSKLDIHKPQEKDYKLKRKNSVGRLHEVVEREHDQYMELRKIYDELENQLEVSKPLVNLVDNMVRMGSLYGGDNLMLASQYKQHKLRPGEYTPPKKMIMFSRQYQEQKLTQLQEAELKQLMDDEVDLEEKLQQLYQLDRELQEKSLAVTNLQEKKDLLENTVSQLRKELKVTNDPRTAQNIKFQLRHLEAELVKIRQQLAESSKLLEETSAEDARVENEVMLLRKKIYGMNRTQSTPSLTNDSIRAKQKLEQELEGVQNVMNNLSKQGAMLSDTIKALRHSTPDLTAAASKSNNEKTYLETDIDTGRSRDLGKELLHTDQEEKYGKSPYGETRKEENIYASVKKFSRNDEWHVRDRSRSEPPTARRDNNWQGGIEATEVKTRIEPTRSQIQQQTVAPRDGSTYRMSNQRTSGYDSRQRGMGQEPSQLSPYRTSSQQEGQSGLYRAERKVVTANNLDHHGYQYTSPTSLGSQNEDSMDAVRQQSHHSSSQDHMRQQTYETQSSNKPMSEVHPQQQQQTEQMAFSNQVYDASYSTMSSDSRVYEPIELSQADENTKKFFGILPKDAGKSQTVREVKKEAERRSRERKRFYVNVHGSVDLQQAELMSQDLQRSGSLPHKTSAPSLLMSSTQSKDDSTLQRRKSVGVYRPKQQNKTERPVSATERLFPKQSQAGSTVNLNSRDSVRRISDIFSPRPFTPTTSTSSTSQSRLKSFGSSVSRQGNSSATVATVRPVVSRREGGKSWSTENLSRDDEKVNEYWKERVKNRHTPRGRFMTISSTEPIRMETGHGWKPSKHQSAAGDLISGHWHDVPDYIQSEPLKDLQIDSETIDREVLYVPEKVPIPERYVPDSDDEETEEDRERRLVKGEQIKRMLAAQSLAEWRHGEVGLGSYSGPIHKQVEAERKRREHILDLKQALAVQVTQRSKEVAGSSKSTQNYQPADVSSAQKYSELDPIQPGSRSYSRQPQLYSEDGYRGLYQ